MENKRIKNIVIVGGGTSGWMAASAISKMLGQTVNVTLIESDEISTVGVGEATIPPIILFNGNVGANEQEFMASVRATVKLGISFENWRVKGEKYFHGFGSIGKDVWSASFQHFWRKGIKIGVNNPISEYSFESQAAAANKFAHGRDGEINYAYHLDAGYYAKFLRKIAEAAGAVRIEGRINHVKINDQTGYIESVSLASGQIVEGDFFIDCSGFRGILIREALKTDYEDWSHWLPCDSAVAVQTESVGEPVPYTRSIAHDSGWQWQIPLQHRTGNGLVYCSRYMSDEDAKKTLLENIQGKTITEPKVIKYKTGQHLKYWNKNCVALGLASGFIEPLESTSIHLVQRGITRFLQMFPTATNISQTDIDEYNEQMKLETWNIRDFIILHYHVTDREDSPFWRECKNMDIPKSLSQRIEMFKESGRIFLRSHELFSEISWLQVMVGQGLLPKTYHPMIDQMDDNGLVNFLSDIRSSVQAKVNKMPSHHEYLNYYCKSDTWDKAN